jgi:hypothetical protein
MSRKCVSKEPGAVQRQHDMYFEVANLRLGRSDKPQD